MSNYLTTNPVFKLAKHDNDLARRYYFDAEKELKREIDDIEKKFPEKSLCKFGRKKNLYACYKSNVKQRIITIIREIELKNLEYTKELVIILGKYRNIYTKIIIDENDNDNRIHQMKYNDNNDGKCPIVILNDEIQRKEKQEPIEEIEINLKDEIQIPESKENIKIVTPEPIVSKEEEQQNVQSELLEEINL